ncbi:MAG: hypothetical protein SF339_29165 [Blastocatellia bacterium]|nr:hypothetical protein [Blastocatellia bacterium]
MVRAAGPAPAPDARDSVVVGQLIASGAVTVNDKKASNGTTVFSNSRISVACAKGTAAIVSLGRLGKVELTPGAKMMLKFADGVISGEMIEGKAVVSTPPGVRVSIATPDGVATNDGKDAAVTPVNTQRGVRCVPAMIPNSSNSTASLSSGALAAVILGAGGVAAAGAVVASTTNNAASNIIP